MKKQLVTCHRLLRGAAGRSPLRRLSALLGMPALLLMPGLPLAEGEAATMSELQARALRVCRAQRGPSAAMPPKPFTTDGCSMWPDSDWGHCCIAHDIEYWCGGSARQRWASDRALQQCLADSGKPVMGLTMRVGTRLGGWAVLPLPWRWGYGWPYPSAGQ